MESVTAGEAREPGMPPDTEKAGDTRDARYPGKPQDLVELTAVEALELMEARQLSPVELVQACLDEIEAGDARLQAWVMVAGEEALAAAREAEKAIMRGEPGGPLRGIPFGVKDVIDVAGVATRAGSKAFFREPAEDAVVVRRLKEAGAIFLGKTTTAELAYFDPPPTRNPWNPAHTPGGSSSGSAAAVAARMVPVSLGTQTAGSLVRPAAFCGITTLKGTYGLVSRAGVVPSSWTLDHVGAFTRSAADQALVFPVLCGEAKARAAFPQGLLPCRVSTPARLGEGAVEWIKGQVLGVPDRFFYDVHPAVGSAFDEALRIFRDMGARVERVRLPSSFEAAQSALYVILRAETAAYHKDTFRRSGHLMGPNMRRMLTAAHMIPAVAYERAQQLRRVYIHEMKEVLRGVAALLTPSTPAPAPEGLGSTGSPVFNGPFTLAGFPVIGFPAGFASETGLPVGVQAAAVPFAEGRLLALAAAFQEVTRWHRARPRPLKG